MVHRFELNAHVLRFPARRRFEANPVPRNSLVVRRPTKSLPGMRHIYGFPSIVAIERVRRLGKATWVQAEFPAASKRNPVRAELGSACHDFIRISCKRCAEKNDASGGNSMQKFAPGLHMYLARDKFVDVKDNLWSLNDNRIRRVNRIL